MEKSKRLLTLIAIVTVLTISGIAFAITEGWFTFILTPDLDTPDITLQEPFTLTSLPDYFQVSVTMTGSGNTGQEHQGSIIIEHDRADGGFWEVNGSYELALEHINGTTVETIDVGSFTNLREYETYGNPFIWTSAADPLNYLLVLEIFDVWWMLVTECIITATVETTGGTIASEGINASYGVPYDFTVLFGDPKGFTIVPDVGYEILNVVVDGTSIGPSSSHIFNSVQEDHSIEAFFAELGYTYASSRVSMNGGPISITGASFNGSDPKTYSAGETVSFVINATMVPGGPTYDIHTIIYDVLVAKVGDTSQVILEGVTQTFDPEIPPLGDFAFIGSFTQPAGVAGDWEITIYNLQINPIILITES